MQMDHAEAGKIAKYRHESRFHFFSIKKEVNFDFNPELLMKNLILLSAMTAFLFLSSCGGGGASKDAKAFCECVKSETPNCDNDMEALEDAFKKDPKRFEAFKEAATKECPDAKDIIERMN